MILKKQGLRKRTWAKGKSIFLPFAAISSKAGVQLAPQTPGTDFFIIIAV